ncbi:MAG: alpha/beta fold hydrolase [Prevotellaceae bacterium]|jgi:homoserine O-acetyltransferase|nr:alpha/beta fold hydrolase [Prevotellaceae bacterium]
MLEKFIIENYVPSNGSIPQTLVLSYQIFGRPLHSAPVVLINHALTGNSNVLGTGGWWNNLFGAQGAVDTEKFTVLAFNIPGNGFGDSDNRIDNYRDFTVADVARIFWHGIDLLGISELFAATGSSLGGAVAWEMAAQRPDRIRKLIPVATHWQSTDWLIAHVLLQDLILNNSPAPVHDARIHGMLLYRTPQSLRSRFGGLLQPENQEQFQIESWLLHHGNKLDNRFSLPAYKLMNYLLRSIDITKGRSPFPNVAAEIMSDIHFVAINTDLFFPATDTQAGYEQLKALKSNVFYHEIQSIHGHDAFLIEYDQLNRMLKPVFG